MNTPFDIFFNPLHLLFPLLFKNTQMYLIDLKTRKNPTISLPTNHKKILLSSEFIRSRDRASQRFFTSLTGTQLFSSFIEERSLTSFAGGEGDLAAGRSSSLVFFDECIDRLIPEHASDNIRLIEADDSLKRWLFFFCFFCHLNLSYTFQRLFYPHRS